MKTLKISKEEMLKRVSVFKDLKPLPIQLDKNIPQEGKDIVYARKLLSVIGLDPSEPKTPYQLRCTYCESLGNYNDSS